MSDQKSQFYTREPANAGVRVPLFRPDGTPTEHWLQVRGIDSDAFHAAQAASRQRLMAASANPERISKLDPDEERVILVAALIAAWSFEEPCTPDNVAAFLRNAPQITTEVDRIASNRRSFFVSSSNFSSSTLEPSSSSAHQ